MCRFAQYVNLSYFGHFWPKITQYFVESVFYKLDTTSSIGNFDICMASNRSGLSLR